MVFEASSIKQKQESKNPEVTRQRSTLSSTSTKTHSVSFAAVVAGKLNDTTIQQHQEVGTISNMEQSLQTLDLEQPNMEKCQQQPVQEISETAEIIMDQFQQTPIQQISESVVDYLTEEINLESSTSPKCMSYINLI